MRWAWIDGLCPVCRSMGGVMLFNRAIQARIAIEQQREPAEDRQRRLDRRRAWFEHVLSQESKNIARYEKMLQTAHERMEHAGRQLATDVDLP